MSDRSYPNGEGIGFLLGVKKNRVGGGSRKPQKKTVDESGGMEGKKRSEGGVVGPFGKNCFQKRIDQP